MVNHLVTSLLFQHRRGHFEREENDRTFLAECNRTVALDHCKLHFQTFTINSLRFLVPNLPQIHKSSEPRWFHLCFSS